MSSPYRDTHPAEDNEPAPDFGRNERILPGFLFYFGILLVTAAAVATSDRDAALQLLAWMGPALLSSACGAALYEPVGRWLAVRRARAVIEGVAALEAKANASARQ